MPFRNTICYCYDLKIQYLTVLYTMEMGPFFVCFLLKKMAKRASEPFFVNMLSIAHPNPHSVMARLWAYLPVDN